MWSCPCPYGILTHLPPVTEPVRLGTCQGSAPALFHAAHGSAPGYFYSRYSGAEVKRVGFTVGTFPFTFSFFTGGAQYDQNHIILNTASKEKLTQVWEAMVL